MKKLTNVVLASQVKKKEVTLNGRYSYHVQGYDWGCGIDKVDIYLEAPINQVDVNTFEVVETKQVTDFSQAPEFPMIVADETRKITAAYLVDEMGKATLEPSNHIVLELYNSPTVGSALVFDMKTMFNRYCEPHYLTITLAKQKHLVSKYQKITALAIDKDTKEITTAADKFNYDTFIASDGTIYPYAYYVPEKPSHKLVVWLHGLGEGGTEATNAKVTVLANKVTALIGDEFQSIVQDAHVLAMQCPTYWMDKDGKTTNFNHGQIVADAHSYYTQSLKEMIEFYQKKYSIEKTVLTGCSNGGYMTMIMAINYPTMFDAYVPICEALGDKHITDENIKDLAKLPIFFIYSEDDPVVVPELHEIPTIQRLKDVGAKNVCVSTSKHVIDLSGKFKDKDGQPYTYSGHWSWIYFDNNVSRCDECQEPVFQWISKHL